MKSVVDILSDLIRIPSNSAVSNRPLIHYAAVALHAAGWAMREYPYRDASDVEKVNLIAAPPAQSPDDPAADLVFMCHTDTVPYAADWAEALNPTIKDDQLHGCGACDVKAYLACLLAVVSHSDSREFRNGLRIVLTADEEIGCVGAARLVTAGVLRPRRVVIGEPTQLHPARAGKGYCLAEIVVHGREAHSAHPEQGVSAIFRAARLITALEEFSQRLASEQNGFFHPAFTTLNVGIIEGGTAKNVVPGSCRFQLEWRPIPGQDANAVLASVTGIVTHLRAAHLGFDAEIHPLRQQPGFETPAQSPLVRKLESLSGRAAVSIPFGSEASIFAPLAEEVIVFGPGDMRTAHSSRECVPVAELDEAATILASLMQGA